MEGDVYVCVSMGMHVGQVLKVKVDEIKADR